MNQRALKTALAKLRSNAPNAVPGSHFSSAQRLALDRFARQTGALLCEPKGRGVQYRITDTGIVQRHWQALTPFDDADLKSLPPRAANIANARSSKAGNSLHEKHYLLIKSQPDARWSNRHQALWDVAAATARYGVAALAIAHPDNEDPGWRTDGTLWLVENQALFDNLCWLPKAENTQSVIYYGGQLRNTLIYWLARAPRSQQLMYFSDYDGVGLLNYSRLFAAVEGRVCFWLMPDWPLRLQRYGCNRLWRDTDREWRAASSRLTTACQQQPELADLMDAMQQQGLALEQESIWLPVDE